MSDIKDNVSYAFREPGCEVTALEMDSDTTRNAGPAQHILDYMDARSDVMDLAQGLKLRIRDLLSGDVRDFFDCGMHALIDAILKNDHATSSYIKKELKSALDKLKKYRDKYGDLENE